jgi:hypothetical protein
MRSTAGRNVPRHALPRYDWRVRTNSSGRLRRSQGDGELARGLIDARLLPAEGLTANADFTETDHHAPSIRWPPKTELRAEAGEE